MAHIVGVLRMLVDDDGWSAKWARLWDINSVGRHRSMLQTILCACCPTEEPMRTHSGWDLYGFHEILPSIRTPSPNHWICCILIGILAPCSPSF